MSSFWNFPKLDDWQRWPITISLFSFHFQNPSQALLFIKNFDFENFCWILIHLFESFSLENQKNKRKWVHQKILKMKTNHPLLQNKWQKRNRKKIVECKIESNICKNFSIRINLIKLNSISFYLFSFYCFKTLLINILFANY